MYLIEKLYEPLTIHEALELLDADKSALIIAGGTDLLVRMRHNRASSVKLVSIRNIEDLKKINILDDGAIEIGSFVTFTQLAESGLILDSIPMLKGAALSMGGPQIRNAATVGGNICNGATSADGAPSLFALDAKLELVSKGNKRIQDIQEFYLGPSKVDLKKGEILSKIIIPKIHSDKWAGSYTKFSVRKAMDISMLGCAVVCVLNEDNAIKDLRIALGTAGPTPFRCCEAERVAIGKKLTKDVLEEIGQKALLSARPRSSWRASKEYRECLIIELVMRTLQEAYEKAGGDAAKC
jgi:xanthine dehydrogenase FAD-binding subunit